MKYNSRFKQGVLKKVLLPKSRQMLPFIIFSSQKNPIPCAAMEERYEAAQYERTK